MPSQDKPSPVIIAACCVCGQVLDDEPPSETGWMTLDTYLHRHEATRADFQLSHTYCPTCYTIQARAWQLSSSERISRAA